jgi:uncharacterized protein YndB with AHSA1/START domain
MMNEVNGRRGGVGAEADLGSYVEQEGRPAVRFVRTYPHAVERVWTAITEPGELRQWFPFHAVIEPRVGGVAKFGGNPHMPEFTGRVLVYEPPRRLAFSWGDSELRFELEALEGGRCRLTLTDVLEAPDTAARNGAGWNMCLRELDKLLVGEETSGLHTTTSPTWQQYYDGYVAAGIPHGAAIPGRAD